MKTKLSLPARVYPWLVTFAAVGFAAYWLHAWLGSPPAAAGIALMAALWGLGILAQRFPLAAGSGQKVDVPVGIYLAGLFLVGLLTALTASQHSWVALAMAPPAAILYLSLRRTIQLLASEQAARAQAEAAERIRQLQRAIEREWAPLAAVLAGMSDGVLVLDAARRVRYCNTRAGELLGLDPSAVVGQDGEELVDHLGLQLIDRRAARSVWGQVITDPHECPSGEINTADGPARRVILLSAFPVVDAVGGGLGLLLRDVTDSKVRAARQERDRIAMNLHDGVVQSLYAVVLGLTVLERSLNGRAAAVQAPLRKHRTRIEAVIEEIRNHIFDLRSRELYGSTLRAGLSAIVEELHDNSLPGIQVDADVEGLDPDDAANILLIVREATSNVIRHARASTVVIRLVRVDGRLVLTIRDDGRGFDPHAPTVDPPVNGQRSGQGLRNMAERAGALGGRVTVSSQAGRGTEVRLEIPPPELSEENDRAVREAAVSR